jgi:hypothetical protein
MASYTVYSGQWVCHTCKATVMTLRCYAETKTLTWMCKDKHLTTVYLGRRKRSDFQETENEV